MNVCFFGAYDPSYPRNRILREGLHRAGVGVIEVCAYRRRGLSRHARLALGFLRHGRAADIVFVPEFRHKDVPLAATLKGRRPLVFDPLVSRHDTLVRDWGLHAEGSAQARWNEMLDRRTMRRADLVLCDTWAHGALFESLGVARARLRRVLVGAEDAFFAVPPPADSGLVRIVYVGGFLPLHGVPAVIEALSRLERDAASLPEFRVEFVGKGIEFARARELAERLKVQRIDFAGPVDYADSPRVLADAHIVLGAFGASDKAGRVIPHKVYQGVAAGRAVLTGDGAGLREVFEPGVHLDAVARDQPAAIAQGLRILIGDAARRARLGAAGRARAVDVATPQRIGESLRAALSGEGSAAP
jgi:glycosyltransferase involved in cell wall biosynthesis